MWRLVGTNSIGTILNARSIKTATNQIDCYVRSYCVGALPYLGERFVVECKNEKKKPDNTYFHKLMGIIRGINGGKDGRNIVKLGIIVAMKKPAKTISQFATLAYAKDDIVMITIDEDDLKDLVLNRVNLLEMIERKIDEVVLNVTSDLKAIGMYDA